MAFNEPFQTQKLVVDLGRNQNHKTNQPVGQEIWINNADRNYIDTDITTTELHW